MIVKMKKVFLFTQESKKRELLHSLRSLGVMHIEEKKHKKSNEALLCQEEIEKIDRALRILSETLESSRSDKKDKSKHKGAIANVNKRNISKNEILEICSKVLELKEKKDELKKCLDVEIKERDNLMLWGDYNPEIMDYVKSKVKIRFALVNKKEFEKLKDNSSFIVLKHIKSDTLVAVLGDYMFDSSTRTLGHHEKSVSTLKENIICIRNEINSIDEKLKEYALNLDVCKNGKDIYVRNLEFVNIVDSMQTDSKISYFTGFVPQTEYQHFKDFAKEYNYFGYYARDAIAEDLPPTLLENRKYSSMLAPVLGLLSLLPGYHERDISFFFLTFFAVFFALIIGDAAYGLVFLIFGLVLRLKQKKWTNLNALLVFLGSTTIIWGAMCGTYFASKLILEKLPFLRMFVVPGFASFPELFSFAEGDVQNNIMRLCFSLGALQLSCACIMNVCAKSKNKDLSLIADIGWFFIIISLYFMVLFLLIAGQLESVIFKSYSSIVISLILLGFALIVIFGGQKPGLKFSSGLKSGLKDIFTTFLNIVSSFGNIMSYIRLFAVGMASVAIAESFNSIATPLVSSPLWILGGLVLVLGHTLNLVMGLLSVVVHGVRLNIMEFSGQLGLEWSGYEYKPFK